MNEINMSALLESNYIRTNYHRYSFIIYENGCKYVTDYYTFIGAMELKKKLKSVNCCFRIIVTDINLYVNSL